MLKARFFHANAIDKLTKLDQQVNDFLQRIGEDAVVSMNATQCGSPNPDAAYSYIVVIIYKE